MLQVRNSDLSYTYRLFIAGWIVITVLFSGCDRNNEPVEPAAGTTSDSPDWKAPDSYDITSSMTAIVKVDVASANEDDLLAAFSEENCVGLTRPQSGLCFLFISGPAKSIQLRFYSGEHKLIYTARQTFPFVNDGHLGSVSEPYTPTWDIAQ